MVAATLVGLFLLWGNSFIAIGHLLGGDAASARFDWWTLVPARYVPVGLLAGAWCLTARRRATRALLTTHPVRVTLAGILAVPVYALALHYGQGRGVPAPVASLATALCPLFVIALAAAFLGERLGRRQFLGLAIALGGMAVIGWGGDAVSGDATPAALAITLVAPLAWAIYTIVSKPVVAATGPATWSLATLAVGALFVLPVDSLRAARQMAELDAVGWGCLLFLVVPCAVLGIPVWAWLLRHLDASTLGMTILLNPPITTLSKFVLHRIWPGLRFTLGAADWVGGALALAGLAVALAPRRRSAAVVAIPGAVEESRAEVG